MTWKAQWYNHPQSRDAGYKPVDGDRGSWVSSSYTDSKDLQEAITYAEEWSQSSSPGVYKTSRVIDFDGNVCWTSWEDEPSQLVVLSA